MDNSNPASVWKAVIDSLRDELGSDNVELWLKPVDALSISTDTLVLRVPNKFFIEEIKKSYEGKIESALRRVSASALRLEYEVSKDLKDLLPRADPIEMASSQSDFPANAFNPRYTFSTFVVGASSRFAHATAEAIAKSPGRQFNPFFIYGGVGLGKTHLMHALGHALRKNHAHARVLYTTSEQFVNEFIDSLRYDKPDAFRNKFRNLDCLLIDDIQFLIAKGRSEEEFFFTFNSLFDSHKQIVISSDRAPKEMAPSEQRLISRFEWGVVADIKPPDLETRIAILRKKAESEKIFIPDDVILFIATAIKTNIRALEGALIRLCAFASLTGQPLSVDSSKELLKDSLDTDINASVRVETIQKVVSEKYSLDIKDLKSRSRSNDVAFPRQLGMYLSCELTSLSMSEIGKAFGGRDHSTVVHARDKIKSNLEKDPWFLEMVNKLIEKVKFVDNQ